MRRGALLTVAENTTINKVIVGDPTSERLDNQA